MTKVTITATANAAEKKKADGADGMSLVPFERKMPIITHKEQHIYNGYVVLIEGEIGDIADFANLIELFAYATENDTILLQLFCPGGSMETTEYLCRRMDECAAKLIAEIGLTCASGASALAMHADEWHIYDSSTMMIHSCSYGTGYAKESDIHGMVDYTHKMNRDFVERTYTGFLTPQEMTDVLRNGHNMYFHADELRKREPLYREYLAEQQKAYYEALGQELEEEVWNQ